MYKRMLRSTLATVIFSAVAFGGVIGASLGALGTLESPPDSGWDSSRAAELTSGWRSDSTLSPEALV